MKTLKELKIEMELASKTYLEAFNTIKPYQQAYYDARAAYDSALDDALEDAYAHQEKKAKNK